MITFRQGCEIGKTVGMRYEPGWDYQVGEEDPNLHEFHTDRMDNWSCWITHRFFVADSVAEVVARMGVHEEE